MNGGGRMIKFIHAADIHLDSQLLGLYRYEGAPVDRLRNATRRAMDNLVALAVAEKVDFVIIAGDLYDGDWEDYNTGLFFTSRMSRLREAGIPVFITAGNHDAHSRITKQLNLPDNVKSFSSAAPETVELTDAGVAVHGWSYNKRAVTRNPVPDYPTPVPGALNIGVLHTNLDGRPGHEPYAPCSRDDLAGRNYHYWALGHIHRREEIRSGGAAVVYPGNLQGRHIRETGPKGCSLVTADGAAIVDIEHREMGVARWELCEVDLGGAGDPGEALERIAAAMRETVEAAGGLPVAMRVSASGACAAHQRIAARKDRWINEVRRLGSDIGGGSVWIEKVRFATSAELSASELLEKDSALGELLDSIRKLGADPETIKELAGSSREISSLFNKLPPEVKYGADSLDPGDPGALDGFAEDARQLLLARIFGIKDDGQDLTDENT